MTMNTMSPATHSTTQQSRDETHCLLVDSVYAVAIAVLVIVIALGGAVLLVSTGDTLW